MADRMEIKLVLPRWQVWFAWATFITFEALALAIFWQEQRRGSGDSVLLAMRLVQGALLPWGMFGCFATVLEVAGEDLVVTTLWRKLLRRPGLRESLGAVALEWIGGQLTLQRPAEGFILRLGSGPKAREAADWLVARGVRPPVGG